MRSVLRTFSALMLSVMAVAIMATGCAENRQNTRAESRPAIERTQQSRFEASSSQQSGNQSTVYWPTGDRSTSVAAITQRMPAQVSVNQQFQYDIEVTNLTDDLVLSDVIVRNSGEGLNVAQSQPSVEQAGNVQGWRLGNLQPGDSKTVQITASAAAPGQIFRCTTLEYTPQACITANVVQPQLQLTAQAPELRMVCEEIPLSVTVTNTGTGVARNVTITSQLPEGVTTRRNNRTVDINVGTLAQGESRTFTIPVNPTQAGQVQASFNATGEGDLSGQAQTTTNIVAPQLTVQANAPELEYVTKNLVHEYVVTNNGNVEARDAQLVVDISGPTAGGQRTYNLGTIEPNASKTVRVETQPTSMGDVRTQARATAYCAEAQTATAQTAVRGTVGVLLEVVDQNDPVRVGGEEIYTIVVTNQGIAAQTNVQITATLGPNMSFISAAGATNATSEGKTITFAPLPTLGGKQAAKWTVRVRADQAAGARFQAQMTTEQIGEPPVMETESTHFYE